MMGMLSRILQDGFDLAGIRLLYPTFDLMKMTAEGGTGQNNKKSPDKTSQMEVLNNIGKFGFHTFMKTCSFASDKCDSQLC